MPPNTNFFHQSEPPPFLVRHRFYFLPLYFVFNGCRLPSLQPSVPVLNHVLACSWTIFCQQSSLGVWPRPSPASARPRFVVIFSTSRCMHGPVCTLSVGIYGCCWRSTVFRLCCSIGLYGFVVVVPSDPPKVTEATVGTVICVVVL